MLDDARPGPGEPLRSYAAIGDGRTVALIGERGQIDWMPVPDLGSSPVFARILDDDTGGCIELYPDEEFTVTRRYVANTNVLQTTFRTAGGTARVTDAMVTGVAGRLPWAELGRRIEGLKGAIRFEWRIKPGTQLGTASPWIYDSPAGPIIRVGATTVGAVGSEHGPQDPVQDGVGPHLRGSFQTAEGSHHVLIVVATYDEPLRVPDPHIADQGIDRTIASWRQWSRAFEYEGPYAAHVQRSALALKLLIYSPSGAIAAAATTSLPENPRGGKNWDYRFAWVRDLAYTCEALMRFGLREETHAAVSWLMRTIRENGSDMGVFYDLDGNVPEQPPQEYDVPGWRGIGPVVTGNPASSQLQLGVYGDLFSLARTYTRGGNVLDTATAHLLSQIADRTCDLWRNRDSGMWELEDLQHYTSSKMGCWQALDYAVELAEAGHIPGSSDRWAEERERIRRWVETNCWSERVGAYTMHPGTDELDASVLLHSVSDFDRGERMSSTIDAISESLGAGALLYRYGGMRNEEKTFLCCAFWRVTALTCVGRHDEALALMDELVRIAPNDVGIMAEMVDAEDLSFWGNLPQGLSHLALITAAITIGQLIPEGERAGR